MVRTQLTTHTHYSSSTTETVPTTPIVPLRPTTDDPPKSVSMLARSRTSSSWSRQLRTRCWSRSFQSMLNQMTPDEAASSITHRQMATVRSLMPRRPEHRSTCFLQHSTRHNDLTSTTYTVTLPDNRWTHRSIYRWLGDRYGWLAGHLSPWTELGRWLTTT